MPVTAPFDSDESGSDDEDGFKDSPDVVGDPVGLMTAVTVTEDPLLAVVVTTHSARRQRNTRSCLGCCHSRIHIHVCARESIRQVQIRNTFLRENTPYTHTLSEQELSAATLNSRLAEAAPPHASFTHPAASDEITGPLENWQAQSQSPAWQLVWLTMADVTQELAQDG